MLLLNLIPLIDVTFSTPTGCFANHRNKSVIFTAKPYENPAATHSSSEQRHLTAHVGRRLQGSIVRFRNDSGLRKSPTPHHT
jgi:hypothetical protein